MLMILYSDIITQFC